MRWHQAAKAETDVRSVSRSQGTATQKSSTLLCSCPSQPSIHSNTVNPLQGGAR
jgi:hypothetical protein